ncbi:hypothetical protein [Elioraea tepidiphila]|uniref:hypothetical protein n=1 Tax=Elioraea tepidiphila TaxID=457934 RepID=UPI00037C31F9|nr:hypothetical protein [Elioraea tepidiphila]
MLRTFAFASALLFAGTVEAYWQVAPYPELDRSRAAAEKYVDVQAALDDGYRPMFGCVAHASHGAMGVHYIHAGRLNDGTLVLEEPDTLMSEPQPDGSLKLVAIEHIVWEKDWPSRVPPTFLGQRMRRKTSVGHHQVEPFYEIHVWHWRDNPSWLFGDWNPAVMCAPGEIAVGAASAP